MTKPDPQPFDQLAPHPTGPLAGVRIVDLTSVVFGAYATQILADLGAEVIKVESPGGPRAGGGDVQRWTGDAPAGAPDLGPTFVNLNRNKRSLLLDLNEAASMAALRELIAGADMFAATIRYEGMKRLGLDYESVKKFKPDILYVHGSGYGSSGPYAGQAAHDDLIQAQSGCADLIWRVDGSDRPRYLPTLAGDKISGLFLAQAMLAGLFHRQRTGEGQFVEVPMFESVTSFVLTEHFFGHVYDPPTGPWGYQRIMSPDRKPFKTKDGFISVLFFSIQQWRRFFRLAGQDELVDDLRFIDQEAVRENIAALHGLLERTTVERTSSEWVEALAGKGVQAAAVNRLEDLQNDPHLKAVGFFQHLEHPDAGAYAAMRSPLLFEKTPASLHRHAPRLGEHNAEILGPDGAVAPAADG